MQLAKHAYATTKQIFLSGQTFNAVNYCRCNIIYIIFVSNYFYFFREKKLPALLKLDMMMMALSSEVDNPCLACIF